MLISIRDHTHGWIATLIISLLILSFALWGVHSYLAGASVTSYAAKVNGVEISKAQVATTYERMQRQTQMQSSSLSAGVEKELKERALRELIYAQILKQGSLQQDYRISSHQINATIQSMPQFQIKGEFSLPHFQQIISLSLYSITDFLDLIKTTLLIEQPRLGTIFTSFSLPNEVENAVALVNQERDIQYAMLPPILQPISISKDKIAAYYQQHAEEYKTPEQVSIDYLELTVANLEKNIHPSQEELKNYYNENTNSFITPATGKQKSAAVQPFEKVKEKVATAVAHQKAEEQFASIREKLANLTYEHPDTLKPAAEELKLVIKTSESFTQDKIGKDIAANSKIREAAFSNDVLNSKNNSDVIQIDSGSAVVVRIKSHLPAATLPLEKVQKQISDKLQAIETNNQLQQAAASIQKKLQDANSPAEITHQYHLNWVSAGSIGRHSTKIDPAILDTVFSMPKPINSQKPSYGIAKAAKGYAIIAVKAVKDGTLKNKDEYRVFAEQIQNTQGLLEYELYKNSLIKKAKVVITS